MTSNSTNDDLCAANDTLCIVREYEQAVIIVPTLLLLAFVVTLLPMCVLRYCAERRRRKAAQRYQGTSHRHTNGHSHEHNQRHNHENGHRHTHEHNQRHSHRHNLQGIDAPPGIDPLAHEELPMTVQQARPNMRPTPAAQTQHGGFSQVAALTPSFFVPQNNTVGLYRARMDNKDVILRVLKESANSEEKQHFLGFASFVSELGPHPFIPTLLGAVSLQPPLIMVVEELHHRDLLGFLWRCRQDNVSSENPCDMTEKRIFTMAGQVASALEYLHAQRCIHGNVGARSVLVGADMTAKLWGLGPSYRRRTQAGSPGEVDDMELRKWQAPEMLAGRPISQRSDIWSFGILLYEMVTLGDPPFAQLMATELLQYLQRGKYLKRPVTCSNSLYSIIRSCTNWNPQQRVSMSELIRKLQAGERSANGTTVLRVTEPLVFEKYLREAGYGEAYNYAVL
ncbi:tyrosine-protein kinase STYK1 [Mugil cephalus]|uniref:tyrosine-protein kinase STYK1 n=1 Tax=Mugil cephalus TaxID=48193 RepID=UPI001FB5B79D|nr:tyrosine-protein kinase STYK1 [Mugil cephalus]